jgi:hypothetical protein
MYNNEQLDVSIKYLQTELKKLKKEVNDLRDVVSGLLSEFNHVNDISKKQILEKISKK